MKRTLLILVLLAAAVAAWADSASHSACVAGSAPSAVSTSAGQPGAVGTFVSRISSYIKQNNKLNSTLYERLPQDEWVRSFENRGRDMNQLNGKVQGEISKMLPMLDTIASYQHELDSLVCRSLMQNKRFLRDNFLQLEILQRRFAHGDTMHIGTDTLMALRRSIALSYLNISHMGDAAAYAEFVRINLETIHRYYPDGVHAPLTTLAASAYCKAISDLLLSPTHQNLDVISPAQLDSLHAMSVSLQHDAAVTSLLDSTQLVYLRSAVRRYPSVKLRHVLLPAWDSGQYRDETVALMKSEVERYGRLSDTEKDKMAISDRRIVIRMRYLLGQITAMQGHGLMMDMLAGLRSDSADERSVNQMLATLKEGIMYVDESDLSEARKHRLILQHVDTACALLRELPYTNSTSDMTSTLVNMATYQRLHQHLNTAERKRVLEQFLFYSQPFTRAHSLTVTALATAILQGVIKYHPEWLVGMCGYRRQRDVMRHPERVLDFFRDGAKFHDLGKTRMPDIVRCEYRRLTDREYDVLKRHPEYGLEFLAVDTALLQLHDVVLGHHKWYNGKGGYPASFDNVRSPYHLLIDILTLGDCMEAATSHLGRNYRRRKTCDDVIGEFEADAGTRYNTLLVQLITEHDDIRSQLRDIAAHGWEDIYYHAFNSEQ